MRLLNALKGDVLFQYRNGFYAIYAIISIIYIMILNVLPEDIKTIAIPVVVFTDPTVIGLFFIGGIIMLEKIQGVTHSIVVTPLKVKDFILSKLISLSAISVISSLIIAYLSTDKTFNVIVLVLSIILSSSFFTLMGVIIASSTKTLNGYFVKMIVWTMLVASPLLLLMVTDSNLLSLFPVVAMLRLVMGAFNSIGKIESLLLMCYLILINYLTFRKTIDVYERKVIYGE